MTQLMLFDAPTRNTIPTDAVQPAASKTQTLRAPETVADGPQRMGNLAHLVLARYDMVARRREARREAVAARAMQPAEIG